MRKTIIDFKKILTAWRKRKIHKIKKYIVDDREGLHLDRKNENKLNKPEGMILHGFLGRWVVGELTVSASRISQ